MLSYINPFSPGQAPNVGGFGCGSTESSDGKLDQKPVSLTSTSIQIPTKRDKRDSVALEFLAGLTSVPSGMYSKQNTSIKSKKKGRKGGIASYLSKGKDGLSWNISAEKPPKTFLPKNLSLMEITICQEISVGTILSTNTISPSFAAYFFAASTVGNFTSIAAVFDQYKVEQLELWLTPEFYGAGAINSLWSSVIDLDDATVLASYGLAGEYETTVESLIGVGHYRKWKPHIAVATYSGVFTSFKNEPAGWIDCASPSVQHYGVKIAAQATPSAGGAIAGTVRVVMSFRGTH